VPKARSAVEKRKFAERNGFIDNIDTVNAEPVPWHVIDYTMGKY
jgi:hypothetical protein